MVHLLKVTCFFFSDKQFPVLGFGAKLPDGSVSHEFPLVSKLVRDRPFNLKEGGLWLFVSFRNIFSDELEYLFYLSREARIFFPEFNIRLYDKNSESNYFFFPPPKAEYFFQQHWESEYFFRKKTIQVKWSFPNMFSFVCIFLKPHLHFILTIRKTTKNSYVVEYVFKDLHARPDFRSQEDL
jgi:hypothetical protein